MPKYEDSRISSGDGSMFFSKSPDGSVNNSTDTPDNSGNHRLRVSGRNLGDGLGLYQGANGSNNITLDFRSIVAGDGVRIVGDTEQIIISAPANSSLPELQLLPGVLTVAQGGSGKNTHAINSILLGNGNSPIQSILAPTTANTSLFWDGTRYVWKLPAEQEKIKTTSVSTDTQAIEIEKTETTTNVDYKLDINPSEININSLSNILSASRGGTGITLAEDQAMMVGDGTAWKILKAPEFTSNVKYKLIATGIDTRWEKDNSLNTFLVETTSPYLDFPNTAINTSNSNLIINLKHKDMPLNELAGVLTTTKGGTGLATVGAAGTFLRVSTTGRLAYEAVDIPQGTVKRVTIQGDDVISVANPTITDTGTISLSVNQAGISLDNLSGTLPVSKGGTGLSRVGRPRQLMATNEAGNALEFIDMDEIELPGLSKVATTGLYSDLTGTPQLHEIATTGKYDDLVDKPVFHRVATSGSYDDLVNKPTMNAGTVTSVAMESGNTAIVVTGGPVTTNGKFTVSLSPSNVDITTLSGTLEVNKGGTGLTTLTPNGILFAPNGGSISQLPAPSVNGSMLQYKNGTFEWTTIEKESIPVATNSDLGTVRIGSGLNVTPEGMLSNAITKVGQLENDSNYATTNDLTIYAKIETLSAYAQTSDLEPFAKKEDLSEVATSGSYNDLTDKPETVSYVLPEATKSVLGGVKIADESINVTTGAIKVAVSADADNQLELKADGLYVEKQEMNLDIVADDSLVLDESGVRVKISTTADNQLVLDANGLFVAKSEAGVSLTVDDSLVLDENNIKVKISTTADNQLVLDENGLFVAKSESDLTLAVDDSLVLDENNIKVKISTTADNQLVLDENGLFVAKATPVTFVDSDTIKHSKSTTNEKLEVKISEEVGNKLASKSDGLYINDDHSDVINAADISNITVKKGESVYSADLGETPTIKVADYEETGTFKTIKLIITTELESDPLLVDFQNITWIEDLTKPSEYVGKHTVLTLDWVLTKWIVTNVYQF